MRRKLFAFALVFVFAVALAGCTNFVQGAVDALASANGFITQAQANHAQYCGLHPTQDFPCVIINEAVNAQNAAISGLEAYCQLPAAPDAPTLKAQATAACNENPAAKAVLVSELSALGKIIGNYKAQSGGKP